MTAPDYEGLTPEESKLFDRAMGILDRGPVSLPPTVGAAIMRRIREAPAPAWNRIWAWLVLPRPIAASPLALAAALAVIVTASIVGGSRMPRGPEPTVAQAGDARVTRFLLVDGRASRVTVTGTFAGWDPSGVPLRRLADGLWTGEVSLPPGIHHYVFVVDGAEWRADPNAVWSEDDGLGRRNSVVVVPGAERS